MVDHQNVMTDLERKLTVLIMDSIRIIEKRDEFPFIADPMRLKLLWMLVEANVSREEVLELMAKRT